MSLASRRPLGKAVGGLLGRLGRSFDRQDAILGVLDRTFSDSRPSWAILGASRGTLGPSWRPGGDEQ
eukprot:7938365-Pyramimonas_sp.AAC.1